MLDLNLDYLVKPREIAPAQTAPDYAKNRLLAGEVSTPFFATSTSVWSSTLFTDYSRLSTMGINIIATRCEFKL